MSHTDPLSPRNLVAGIIIGVVVIVLGALILRQPPFDSQTAAPPTVTVQSTAHVVAASTPFSQATLSYVTGAPKPTARENPCTGENVTYDGSNVTVNRRGDCHISLATGEVVAGTADRFQNDVNLPEQPQPPCTAFVIRGPIEMDLKIWHGGWNYHINVFDDKTVAGYLAEKVAELQQHQTCPDRGIKSVTLP